MQLSTLLLQMTDPNLLSWVIILAGAATLVTELTGIEAPYGRYEDGAGKVWGVRLNAKLAWVTQEIPALLVPVAMMVAAGLASFIDHPTSPRSLLAAALLVHYTQRSLIFPLLIRAGKPTPLVVWGMAVVFCCWNGYLQGHMMVVELPATSAWAPHQVAGLLLWAFGWAANLHSDHILRNLRRGPADKGYHIPRGGLFEYVSAANYSAEILEWCGYALAAGRLPAAAFAWFTFCNLAPRGVAHHQWYHRTFKDKYPQQRKAVIPFIW